jgi:lipopolysaccharide export system permease protein
LSVVDRYFLSEIARVFGAILATLLMVTTSLLFLQTLEEVNVGALNADAVIRFLGYQIMRDMATLLPPAFFIGVLVALGRMARDSELIAFTAGGLGPLRVYRVLLLFALPLALVTAWFSLIIQPYASARIEQIREQQKDQANQVAGLQAGRFYQQDEGRVTFYASDIDNKRRFREVFLQDRSSDPPRIIVSRIGYYQQSGPGERTVVLEEGRRYDGTAGHADWTIADFARYRYFTRDDDAMADELARARRSTRPTALLWQSDRIVDRAELQHRISAPLAIFTLGLITVPLTTLSPRQRGTGRMLLAFIAYFAFFNLQGLAETLMEDGVTPAWLGTTWYQAVVIGLVFMSLLPESYWLKRLRGRLGNRAATASGGTAAG